MELKARKSGSQGHKLGHILPDMMRSPSQDAEDDETAQSKAVLQFPERSGSQISLPITCFSPSSFVLALLKH